MDAISLDDWELLLPDHKSSFFIDAECSNGSHGDVGGKDQLLLGAELVVIDMDHFGPTSSHPPAYDHCILDEQAKKPFLLLPSEEDAHGVDPIADYKDIDVVAPAETEREELVVGEVIEILVDEAEEQQEEETVKSVKEADHDDDGVLVEAAAAPDGVSRRCAQEEEEEEGVSSKTGFGVGNLLRGNGVGALCSFGVAAATFFILLLGGGGNQQQHKRQQDHKFQLQPLFAGDERIQQVVVVQQASSRLNQTMSSVMGGASSARASISFGGYYQGF